MSKDKVHVAFMFASPLSYSLGTKHAELYQLNFKDEAKRIKNKAKKSKKAIIFEKSVLTIKRLLEMLKKDPSIIHISCHGLENSEVTIGRKF